LAHPALSGDDGGRAPEAPEAPEARLDALNEAILHGVRARGRCITSSTRVGGRFAIRPCYVNQRSGLADADALVDEVLAVGRQLAE
jgi:aromatic-L-amino-acid/L-tryptophan decarboxylase